VEWEEGEEAPTQEWPYDIHNQAGLTCADCHGGDATLDDMDEVRDSKGYRGVPSTAEIPRFCGRCHSDATYMKKYNPALPVDQVAKYVTSRHGVLLNRGDDKVATCISCHSIHNISPASSPRSSVYPTNLPRVCADCHSDAGYMAEYGIPTDQFEKFASSVHGQALLVNEDIGAPACNDCHGNHGAAPPGVENISAVCGLCHAKVASLFSESPHKAAFEENDFPQCETCHSNHDIIKPLDNMVGTGQNSFCIDCHSEDDGNSGFETASIISILLDSLVREEQSAIDVIDDAETRGMEVDDERFALKDVHSSLVESRALVHSFNLDEIRPELEKGIALADATRLNGLAVIDNYYFRRKGLGISTIIITLLAIIIWMKIKRIERRSGNRA
jgi:predicted CXXCH cytochrome family protein